MNAYTLKLNLESGSHQAQIIDTVKAAGGEVIQTSAGLCIRTQASLEELKSCLKEKQLLEGATLQSFDMTKLHEATPDVQAFLQS